MSNERPIVLIHGLWMTPLSWEHWIDRYERRGHTVVAPPWPGMEAGVEELRRDPSGIARLGVAEIVDSYEEVIGGLDSTPIIMGHSFGGLFTQLLLDRGLGAAGFNLRPGKRSPFTHRHREAEEVYVVLRGTGRAKLDGELVDVRPLDAIRVAPATARAFEAGPEGLELIAFGPRHAGDGEPVADPWTDA